MKQQYKFRDLQRVLGKEGLLKASLNDLYAKPGEGADGKFVPAVIETPQLDTGEKFRLLKPYVSVRFKDQFRAVVPLAVYLALFLILILRQSVDESLMIVAGLFAVIIGLMFFMEGLRIGLMPFGTIIGHRLPQNSPLPLDLLVTFLLGIGVTFAEPAIGALRFLYDWSLKPLIYAALVLKFILREKLPHPRETWPWGLVLVKRPMRSKGLAFYVWLRSGPSSA